MHQTSTIAPAFTPAPSAPRYCVVYFNARLVALGTDKGAGEYAGEDWMTTEAMWVRGDPTGKTFVQLREERAAHLRSQGRGEPPAADA